MARHEATPAESHGEPTSAPHPPNDRPLGPGWFDSSWELRTGLEVREDLLLDARWPERREFTDAPLMTALADRSCLDLEQLDVLASPSPGGVSLVDAFSQFGIDGLELL